MKNKYIIESNIVRIILNRRNGEDLETIIDLEDLDKLLNFKYSWFAAFLPSPKDFYAHSTIYEGIVNGKPTNKTIGLQCFVLGLEGNDNCHVDHINHNSLDNRKENLRVTTCKNNLRHRGSINCNNTSGYRNVSWIDGYWRVQLQINGKNHLFPEKFTDVDEAGEFAGFMRQKYYGEFAGVAK